MHVLSTTVKQELVRYLACRPQGSTALDVAAAFGISRQAAQMRLTDLENAEIVVADAPQGARRGRVIRFTVDHARLDEMIRTMADYVHGC